ncbi:type VII secretion target [Nocardia wallacei]|uniref:type VII secretion target n=1 Tax=Nocardia wallacei TaxID=480035 RepID=UPI002457F320|nr:type VII secretion target [Nocardia wallacei]
MQVDPDALRAWAKWLDGLSGEIKGLTDSVAGAAASDLFPGTELSGSVNAARDQVKSAVASFATRPSEMAEIAKGTGDSYQVEETFFAAQLRAMGGLK